MFDTAVRAGVCSLASPGARWLATGWSGGYVTADAAANLTVPTDFDRTDLAAYASDRRVRAGLAADGPTLLTGVDVAHARGARCEPVTVVATAGLSNPARLPVESPTDGPLAAAGSPAGTVGAGEQREDAHAGSESHADGADAAGDRTGTGTGADESPPMGTVNLLVGVDRHLEDGTLATLLGTAVEAKTATLARLTGFSGTTSDAVAVGCNPDRDPAGFAGSATDVGASTRACVRDAVRASLAARYAEGTLPGSVAEADHGTVTREEPTVFRP